MAGNSNWPLNQHFRWAENTNYAAGANRWQGLPTKNSVHYEHWKQGFPPSYHPSAQELNDIANYICHMNRHIEGKQFTSFQRNRIGASSSILNDFIFDPRSQIFYMCGVGNTVKTSYFPMYDTPFDYTNTGVATSNNWKMFNCLSSSQNTLYVLYDNASASYGMAQFTTNDFGTYNPAGSAIITFNTAVSNFLHFFDDGGGAIPGTFYFATFASGGNVAPYSISHRGCWDPENSVFYQCTISASSAAGVPQAYAQALGTHTAPNTGTYYTLPSYDATSKVKLGQTACSYYSSHGNIQVMAFGRIGNVWTSSGGTETGKTWTKQTLTGVATAHNQIQDIQYDNFTDLFYMLAVQDTNSNTTWTGAVYTSPDGFTWTSLFTMDATISPRLFNVYNGRIVVTSDISNKLLWCTYWDANPDTTYIPSMINVKILPNFGFNSSNSSVRGAGPRSYRVMGMRLGDNYLWGAPAIWET